MGGDVPAVPAHEQQRYVQLLQVRPGVGEAPDRGRPSDAEVREVVASHQPTVGTEPRGVPGLAEQRGSVVADAGRDRPVDDLVEVRERFLGLQCAGDPVDGALREVRRHVDQHETGDTLRCEGGEAGGQDRAEGVPDDDARRDVQGVERGEDGGGPWWWRRSRRLHATRTARARAGRARRPARRRRSRSGRSCARRCRARAGR
ncbi:hypothetical protein DEJ15_12075 [Curtobacterium sp. MCJR17_043]|nr:hypothetical protein [Curtobacterium sp. MCJR17_043]WIB35145.1 hypothetical protein DEJ15_12075 [Curtobacterium sp. MCJR17_043]